MAWRQPPSCGSFDRFTMASDVEVVHLRALNEPLSPCRDLLAVSADLGGVWTVLDRCQGDLVEEHDGGSTLAYGANLVLPHLTEAHQKLGDLIRELRSFSSVIDPIDRLRNEAEHQGRWVLLIIAAVSLAIIGVGAALGYLGGVRL